LAERYIQIQLLTHIQHTFCFITNTNWLMYHREITTVYCNNHIKCTDTPCRQYAELHDVKASFTALSRY